MACSAARAAGGDEARTGEGDGGQSGPGGVHHSGSVESRATDSDRLLYVTVEFCPRRGSNMRALAPKMGTWDETGGGTSSSASSAEDASPKQLPASSNSRKPIFIEDTAKDCYTNCV